MIHPPSLAIGAVIASIAIVAVMFGLNGTFDESELAIKPTPEIDSIGPTEILDYTITDMANGHPRTEIISAIFLHDPMGIVGFEVSDTDNQSDKREIIIH